MDGVHGKRQQSDADAAAVVCEQCTRERCVFVHDIVQCMECLEWFPVPV